MTTRTCQPAFDELAAREPKLLELYAAAKSFGRVAKNDPHFCANEVWYGYQRYHGRGLKERLVQLVGYKIRPTDLLLGSEAAYDVAYNTIYALLPGCRECWCP